MERTIKPETLKNELNGKYSLDVRRADDRNASSEQLAGAHRQAPGVRADHLLPAL